MGKRIIVAGSRHGRLTAEQRAFLAGLDPELLIVGRATGIDADAERWARRRGIRVKPFPVERWEWREVGRKAGPIRNRLMAMYLSAIGGDRLVVLFPGGSGTASMRSEARAFGLPVHEWGSQGP